jgi:hypothetical protein
MGDNVNANADYNINSLNAAFHKIIQDNTFFQIMEKYDRTYNIKGFKRATLIAALDIAIKRLEDDLKKYKPAKKDGYVNIDRQTIETKINFLTQLREYTSRLRQKRPVHVPDYGFNGGTPAPRAPQTSAPQNPYRRVESTPPHVPDYGAYGNIIDGNEIYFNPQPYCLPRSQGGSRTGTLSRQFSTPRQSTWDWSSGYGTDSYSFGQSRVNGSWF